MILKSVNAFTDGHSLQKCFKPLNDNESKTFELCGQEVTKSRTVKYPGAWFDEKLTFQSYVLKIYKSAAWNLKCIQMVRHLIDQESCAILVCSLVLSHLHYANCILFGIADYLIKKMQRIQNFAARVVLNVNRERDAFSTLNELHWLLVDVRIKYKILCTVFKYVHDKSVLAYLRDLLIHNNRNGGVVSVLRSSDRSHLLIVPYVKHQTFAHRAFSVSGQKAMEQSTAKNSRSHKH